MRVLLIEPVGAINKTRTLVPVGIPCLAAVLLEAGHAVEGYNANTHHFSYDENMQNVVAAVENGAFDIVGMGGLCMSFPFQKERFNTLAAMKNRPLLVSGGNMFTSEPEFCMEEYGADFGVFGEGEIPFLNSGQEGVPLRPGRPGQAVRKHDADERSGTPRPEGSGAQEIFLHLATHRRARIKRTVQSGDDYSTLEIQCLTCEPSRK